MSKNFVTTGTIAAIATAVVPGQGSIGVVRISGDEALSIAQKVFHTPGNQVWDTHQVLYGYIFHPETENLVDEALLLIMKAPRSYTREDVIEFHCHGGIIAVQEVLQICIENGARLAQPGEFTLRAFLNGRLDLTQAESITDLVGAKSPQAAQTALAGLRGRLANPIRKLRSECLDILAEIEARIDFEEDLPPLDTDGILSSIENIASKIEGLLATADKGEILRSGLKVAIVGRPNVGKSSLLNAWSRTDRAIVTDLPGTTRDIVESQLVVDGIPIQVVDTAGIRSTEDTVEKIGVERSQRAADVADLVLFTIDAASGWIAEDLQIYEKVKEKPLVLVVNKIDLVSQEKKNDFLLQLSQLLGLKNIVVTAAAVNQGIEDLEAAILEKINYQKLQANDLDVAINQRQKSALVTANKALMQVKITAQDSLPFDFWTIDLRSAIYALGEITGEEVTESVLDRIFSKFCIGK